jgi:hypothetical protein
MFSLKNGADVMSQTKKYRTWIRVEAAGRITGEAITDVLIVLLYIHFNRVDMKLSDFGLQHLEIISNAPHNVTGLDDRLFDLLLSEATSNKVLLDDRYSQIMGNRRSGMNHSDKGLAI